MYVDVGFFQHTLLYSQLLYSLYIFMVTKLAQTSTVQQELMGYSLLILQEQSESQVETEYISSICRLPVFRKV